MGTLPRHFGQHMMSVESRVFDLMSEFCAAYEGGFWQFYELSNGGFYMAPQLGRTELHVPSNGYKGQMSADAAGIVVCLFTFSLLSFEGMGESSGKARLAEAEPASCARRMNGERQLSALGVIGTLIWTLIRLPIYWLLLICEPIVRIGLTTIAWLGILSAVVLEFSGSAPHFPFWGALLLFGSCGLLPLLHRAALRLLAK